MKFLSFFFALITVLYGQTPHELDKTVRKLAPDLVDATIAIMLNGGSGSGVIVSPEGLVITAAHVTSEPGKQMKVLLNDGRELPATSLGVDHGTDGALLKINAPGPFPYRPYVRTKTYEIGDWAIAVGHPGGPVIGRPAPVRLGRLTEAGTKSGFSDAITTTAMVISGDSGGPLFNLQGEVIGINSNISGSWRVNKHVPLPCIIEKWDALLNNESFGRSGEFQQRQGNLFDEPYAELRDRYEEALAAQAGKDPEADALLARPRLLDPHHMQALLDRWAPDEEADKAPSYGLQLDLNSTTPTIVKVEAGQPAAKAGLAAGDQISLVNDAPVTTIGLALKLKAGGTLRLSTSGGKEVTLEPVEKIARRHFPQPVAGMVSMIVTDDPAVNPAENRKSQKAFLAELEDIKDALEKSVVKLKNADGRFIATATVIDRSGQMLTKASEIKDVEGLTAEFQGTDYPVQFRASDDETDLALIRIKAPGLVPVRWNIDEPKTGQLMVSAGRRGLLSGIITQPSRVAPKKGYELNFTGSKPSAYLGVTFSSESTQPVIETVEIGSPADRAGILEGDEILKFEGRKVGGIEDLVSRISKKSPGDKVTILVKRDEEEVKITPILEERPATAAGSFDRSASQRDGALSSLSANGGKLSKRRAGFPLAVYHDTVIRPQETGGPIMNLDGEAIGINIARALRHRSLAIPAKEIDTVVRKLRRKARR